MLRAVGGVKAQLAESVAAFRSVFRNRDLRRLQIAWAGAVVGHWAYVIGVSVYAFQQDGTKGVGVIWLMRMLPAAFASPFTAMLGDRFSRVRVMIASDLTRVVLIATGAIVVYSDGPPWVIYAMAAVVSVAHTPFRPAQAALVPSLATTPKELTAANVVASTIESVGFFVGPAIAGVLLGVVSVAAVFTMTAALVLWSAFFLFLIHAREPERGELPMRASILHEAFAGFRAIGSDSRLRILVGLITGVTLVVGAIEVLLVPLAIDKLDMGDGGVGYVHTAFGIGALLGAFGGLALVGVRRLSVPFIVGVVLFGIPLMIIGLWPVVVIALICFGLVGIGNTLVDVAGFTLVQRAVPDEVLARVFGVIQFLWFGTTGLGAVLTPFLIDWLGLEHAFVAVGLFCPVLVLLVGARLVRIDDAATAPQEGDLRLLRAIPIFAPLPGTTLEHLVGRLAPLRFDTGTEIIRQGDPGDRFYLVAEGDVEVSADGRAVTTLGPGQYFGEIALLRDVPRTATVRAKTPVVLYALEREDFLAAVTGHAPSARAADAVVGARLAALPREQGLVAG
jgi:MFS family permease